MEGEISKCLIYLGSSNPWLVRIRGFVWIIPRLYFNYMIGINHYTILFRFLCIWFWDACLFSSAETRFQVPSICVVYTFHMLGHRSLPGNQGVEAQASDNSRPWRSLEENISNVIRVLYQHSVGKCQFEIHSGFLHANNQVVHPCDHRLVWYMYIWSFIFTVLGKCLILNLISLNCTVVLQWLVWRKYFDWRIWTSLIPIVGGILLTSMTEMSFNMFGFCAALVGCLATSTKTILAESLLHGYKFDRYSYTLFSLCLLSDPEASYLFFL